MYPPWGPSMGFGEIINAWMYSLERCGKLQHWRGNASLHSLEKGLTPNYAPGVPQMGRSGSVRCSGRSMVKALALRASIRK